MLVLKIVDIQFPLPRVALWRLMCHGWESSCFTAKVFDIELHWTSQFSLRRKLLRVRCQSKLAMHESASLFCAASRHNVLKAKPASFELLMKHVVSKLFQAIYLFGIWGFYLLESLSLPSSRSEHHHCIGKLSSCEFTVFWHPIYVSLYLSAHIYIYILCNI